MSEKDIEVFESQDPQYSGHSKEPNELTIGTLVAVDDSGQPLVRFSESNDQAIVAVSTIHILPKHFGRQVALMFVNNDPQKPIIIGLLKNQLLELIDAFSEGSEADLETTEPSSAEQEVEIAGINDVSALKDVQVDGKRVVIEGKDEIVLKCGDSSITLTKAGKILIRGKYILNRSSGVNRILGGSVQVN